MSLTQRFAQSQTIAARIAATHGHATGFDYLRLGLATSVIVVHSATLSYGYAYDEVFQGAPQRALIHLIVPMFFALSGFLVAGSLERCPTLVSFYGLRILRIVPALAAEVLLSAVIFGPILSTVSLRGYFTSQEFYSYFLNVIGNIHYHLPGVFMNNPVRNVVNGQLWTVPFELECYIALGGLALASITKRRLILVAVVIVGQAAWIDEAFSHHASTVTAGANGQILILCFLVGVLFYLYRDKIILNWWLSLSAFLLCVLLSFLPNGAYYLPIPATYLTVHLGLQNPPKPRILFDGDYSYGIYLYGYPCQQVFASLGAWALHWYLNVFVCLPLAFVIARVSWRFIEKPTLALRRYLPELERLLLTFVARKKTVAAQPVVEIPR